MKTQTTHKQTIQQRKEWYISTGRATLDKSNINNQCWYEEYIIPDDFFADYNSTDYNSTYDSTYDYEQEFEDYYNELLLEKLNERMSEKPHVWKVNSVYYIDNRM